MSLKTTKKFYRIGRLWLQLELVLCLFTNLTFLKRYAWRYYNEQNDTQHNNKNLTLSIQHYHVKCRYFEGPFMLSVAFIYCYAVCRHAECRLRWVSTYWLFSCWVSWHPMHGELKNNYRMFRKCDKHNQHPSPMFRGKATGHLAVNSVDHWLTKWQVDEKSWCLHLLLKQQNIFFCFSFWQPSVEFSAWTVLMEQCTLHSSN
jgi:hypothetical protein